MYALYCQFQYQSDIYKLWDMSLARVSEQADDPGVITVIIDVIIGAGAVSPPRSAPSCHCH